MSRADLKNARGISFTCSGITLTRILLSLAPLIHLCSTVAPTPALLEVNFMADWDVAVCAARQGGRGELATEWADDMVTALCTDDELATNPRLIPLHALSV